MSLEFLAQDLTRPHGGAEPVLRSPIRTLLEDTGARFGNRCGWEIAGGFGDPVAEQLACRESVGIADQSCLGKIELQGKPEAVDQIVSDLAGNQLMLGRAADRDGVWWCPLSPSRVLTVTAPESTAEVRARLQDAAARSDGSASIVELTSSLGSNAAVGPLARETFARLSALDLRELGPGGFAPGSVARVPGMVLHGGADRYLHLFGAAYAEYVWTAFLDAAEALGGRAVGMDALAAVGAEIGAGAGA